MAVVSKGLSMKAFQRAIIHSTLDSERFYQSFERMCCVVWLAPAPTLLWFDVLSSIYYRKGFFYNVLLCMDSSLFCPEKILGESTSHTVCLKDMKLWASLNINMSNRCIYVCVCAVKAQEELTTSVRVHQRMRKMRNSLKDVPRSPPTCRLNTGRSRN